MHPELNPFQPGSGRNPPELAGRGDDIAAFDLLIARTRHQRVDRGIILHGLRGVGKTVLLNQFAEQADGADWFTVDVEGQPGVGGRDAIRHRLARGLLRTASALKRRGASDRMLSALRTVKSLSLSLGVASVEIGVEPAAGRGDSGRLEIDLEETVEDLAAALKERSSGMAILIDELGDVDDELMTALLTTQHRANQRDWPFYLIGAGLPDLPSRLSGVRTYAERLFDYRKVGALNPDDARRALTAPVEQRGARFHEDALDVLLEASGGYPYFLQAFGAAVWDAARTRSITVEDARRAVISGNQSLDDGLFLSRWDRATEAERRYLAAMSESRAEQSSTAAIAERMGSTPGSTSALRQRLIDKGVIYTPERGYVSFTVPGMAAFIHRALE